MSNINGSMDYRGFNISGGSDTSGNNPPYVLPDPVDVLNVKTLNIVDNNNQPFYTMPKEQNLISDGALAVFNPDGTSSLQPYTQPAYFYMANSSGGADVDSRGSIAFSENKINSLYNIIRNDDLNLSLPRGTYLCNVSFSPYVQNQPNNTPRSSMYFSIDGSTDTNAPFYFQRTYNINEEFVTFSQIINVDSPSQQIRLEVDNRNNTAGDIIITSCNVSIAKIAPNYKDNIDSFFGQFYADENYTADNKIVELSLKEKRVREIPYNLINREFSNPNTQIVQDGDGFNILQLNGTSKEFYTLQFAGTLGFNCSKNEFFKLTAVFQQSVNASNWYDIDNETTIYINDSQNLFTDVSPIPISLNKYNYSPLQNTNKSYIRVLIRVYPNEYAGTFGANARLFFNNLTQYMRGRTNCMMSIFKLFGSANTRYLMATNGNGLYEVQNYTYGLPAPSQYIINGQILQFPPSHFTLFPLVINNKLLDINGNGGNCRVRIEYPPNNLGALHGSTFCQIVSEITVNVILTLTIDMQFGNSVSDIVVWNVYKNNSFYANINQANLPTPNYSLSFGNITCPVLLEPNKPIFVTMDWQNPLNNTMTMQYRANTKIEIVEA
jgi:hypothetical protein